MITAHQLKSLRGGGQQPRKELFQIYQHDDTEMRVNDANQKLTNARDQIIRELYDTLQKSKQGLKYDIRIEIVFQKSVMNDKGEMEKIKSSPVYRKESIEELFKGDSFNIIKFIENFWKCIDNFEQEGSGWSFIYIKGIELKIYDYYVIAGGVYMELPKKIKNKQACITVKNKDEMCFKWSTLSALHHTDILRDHDRVTKYQQYSNELNEEGLKYPVGFTNKSMMPKFEDNNKLFITVSGLNEDDGVIVYRSPRYA